LSYKKTLFFVKGVCIIIIIIAGGGGGGRESYLSVNISKLGPQRAVAKGTKLRGVDGRVAYLATLLWKR